MDPRCEEQEGVARESAPVICICGPSAAGKTTFADALRQRLAAREVAVLQIACDDYYRSDWIPHPLFGYDTVEAVDGDALRHDLVSVEPSGHVAELRHAVGGDRRSIARTMT